MFGDLPALSDDPVRWTYDERFSVLRSLQVGCEGETAKKQEKMLHDYDCYQRTPGERIKVTRVEAQRDVYGVGEKVVAEMQEDTAKVETTDVARYFLTQCRHFSSEVWPEMSLKSLYHSAITPLSAPLHSEEADVQTIETQPALEPLPTALDLGSDGKELDSSYLGTLPGSSFIITEATPSLREVLGEAIPDLAFVICPTVCSRV